jgi:hypothetical protein
LRDDGGFLERYNDDDNDNARYSHIPGERKRGEEGRRREGILLVLFTTAISYDVRTWQ